MEIGITACRVRCLADVLVVLLLTIPLAAQTHPDFTGRWRLDSDTAPAADVPLALDVRRSPPSAAPSVEMVTVRRLFAARETVETYPVGIVSGTVGGVSADRSQSPITTEHSVRWEGESLTFEDRRRAGRDDWDWRRETWSLDAAGRLEVAMTTDSASAPQMTMTVAYRRQP